MIDRAGIARLIPHQGAMCLLDAVQSWDAASIRCSAVSHRAPGNPLRQGGRLGILCGIEYAGQAMAVHGRLTEGEAGRPRMGFLAALRGVACHAERLDHLPGALDVAADRLGGDAGALLYAFTLHHDGRLLLSGRATVAMRDAPG